MANAGLIRSFRIQRRIIGALLIRESLTRYGRHNLGFLWLFLEPVIFTLGVAALWSALRSTHGSSLPIIGFAITGYSSVLLWRNMPSRCLTAIEPNLALMHHRNVRIMDIFAARIILEVTGVTASFVVLSTVFGALDRLAFPENIPLVALAWIMLAWFGAAMAVTIACAAQHSDVIEKLWHPLSYLLFPLSGAAFMVDWLPGPARELVLLIPIVHCVEMLRDGYFGSAVRAYYSFEYVLSANMLLSLIAITLQRDISRRVLPQ